VLILDRHAVRAALPMPLAITAMKEAFAAQSAGRVESPARPHIAVAPYEGMSLVMAAFVNDDAAAARALAMKVVSVYARNEALGKSRVQAAVLVLDPATGEPRALLEGATLTAIRTAAASAAATDVLARAESHTLAVFGSGAQARAHVEAICAVRPIRTVCAYGRTREKLEAMIVELERSSPDVRFVAAGSAAEALTQADIVVTATSSTVPVFRDADLRAGTHINAIGAYTPEASEIPAQTVARAMVIVDSRAAAWREAGDLIQAQRDGVIDASHVHAELGEIVLGTRPARSDDQVITLFKSVGLAVQDAVAARHAVQSALRQHLGKHVEL
jgi:ornithine cyclodeaminase